VNLSRISRHTKSNETAVIPGKVLASGRLAHKVTIAAFTFSAGAMAKIEEAGGKAMSLVEAAKKHPKGSKLRLIG
jgi:large subunit ribosomal protein L18e